MTQTLANFAQAHDPDRFLAALFASQARREALFTLIAFNHELARAREVASQPMLALIRLQWWREVVEGARRQHEVATPLRHAIDAGLFQPDDLLSMIAAREHEADDEMPDLATWNRYVEGTAGGFAVAAGRMLGANEAQLQRLRSLGAAYGIAGQIALVPTLARRERCQLPADLLQANGLTPFHVIQRPESAEPVLAELAQQGLARIEAAGGRFPRHLIAAALPTVLARRDLRRRHRHRLISDKLAVIKAALTSRIP
jgi:phytoene synthase